jgi:hypothetical protein
MLTFSSCNSCDADGVDKVAVLMIGPCLVSLRSFLTLP